MKIAGGLVFFVLLGLVVHSPGLSLTDGETLFDMKCGKCHARGNATAFGPVKYASVQWERFFKRNKHGRKKDISQEVSEEEIKQIKKYLVDHAADSDRPIAAGLR